MKIFEVDFDEKLSPVAMFSVVREKFGRPSALLESLSFDEKNKMSIIAACPRREIVSSEDSFRKIREELGKCRKFPADFPFAGGLIGYFNFEIFNEIEPKHARKYDEDEIDNRHPNAIFYEFSRFVFFDHERQKIIFVLFENDLVVEDFEQDCLALLEDARNKFIDSFEMTRKGDLEKFKGDELADYSKFTFDQTYEEFEGKVETAKQKILDGEIFQMIISNGFKRDCGKTDGLKFYEVLRELEPTTHLFYLDFAEKGQVVGASPEILGSKRGKKVLYRPIAGTRFRGKDAAEDEVILDKMKNNEKENAEHDMLLDLGRNDLGRICKTGSIKIAKEKYGKFFANVMHLISDLTGEIDDDNFDAVDFFKAIFPAGTLTGAPKIRAVEVINELEKFPRKLYGGAVGYFSVDGNMEFAIAIRSFFLNDGIARFRVGAGIVQDSKSKDEWLEIHNKAKSLAKVFNYVLAMKNE
ncbi:MAG: chorismate-binding protein [Candidatus Peregrinibacteria bacterium]|nr:chorismate-binding protein [Candidatus Peregrinibacteria bacterium]